MEDILGGAAPTDDDVWYETTESLAEPLLACYWSLWECGSGIVAEGMSRLPACATQGESHGSMFSGIFPSQYRRESCYLLQGHVAQTDLCAAYCASWMIKVTNAPHEACHTSHSAF